MKYEVEIYVPVTGIMPTRQIKVYKSGNVELNPHFRDVLNGYFSNTAQDFFILLSGQKGVTTRRIIQTVVGPFYSHQILSNSPLDPLNNFFHDNRDKLGSGVLAVAQEEASIQYDLSSPSLKDAKPLKEPSVLKLHHYFVPNQMRADFENIISTQRIEGTLFLHGV